MNFAQLICPRCGDEAHLVQRTFHQLAADIVGDRDWVHIPDFWQLKCQCGEMFERDLDSRNEFIVEASNGYGTARDRPACQATRSP